MSQSPNDPKAPEALTDGTPTETKEPPMQATTIDQTPPKRRPGGPQPGAGRPRLKKGNTALEQWIDRTAKSKAEVAAAIGISLPALYALLGGETEPRVVTALKIEEISEGEVPVKSWSHLLKASGSMIETSPKKVGGARPGAGRPVIYGDSPLGVWLKAKGMTPSEAATAWNIPLRTLQHVLKTKNPTGKTAFLLEKKTNGEVPASVWFQLYS
jgi:hypothetical protein